MTDEKKLTYKQAYALREAAREIQAQLLEDRICQEKVNSAQDKLTIAELRVELARHQLMEVRQLRKTVQDRLTQKQENSKQIADRVKTELGITCENFGFDPQTLALILPDENKQGEQSVTPEKLN